MEEKKPKDKERIKDISKDIDEFGIQADDPRTYLHLPNARKHELEYGSVIVYLSPHSNEIRFHYQYFDRAMENVLAKKLSNGSWVSYVYEVDPGTQIMHRKDHMETPNAPKDILSLIRFASA